MKAIIEMPRPTTPEEILCLNGMVNYQSHFQTNLSEVMKPLRDLTHKELPISDERLNEIQREKKQQVPPSFDDSDLTRLAREKEDLPNVVAPYFNI